MKSKIVGIFAVASIGALAMACGDSSGAGGAGGGTSVTSSVTSSGKTGTATTGTGTATSTSTGGISCDTCTMGANAAGYAKLTSLVVKSCACTSATASPCFTQCSADPACAATPGTPTGACDTCLKAEAAKKLGSSCTTSAGLGDECQNDAGCKAVVTCELSCT